VGSTFALGRAARLALIGVLGAISLSCGEEILVVTTTRVSSQGPIGRRVEIVGRGPEGQQPESDGWLADEAGVVLARPEAWERIDAGPGRLAAEGYFATAADVPPTLAHRNGDAVVTDPSTVRLEREDLVVLVRWTYREVHEDPLRRQDTGAVVDRLVALAAQAVTAELRRTLGDDLDTARTERLFRTRVRDLVADLLPSMRAQQLRQGAGRSGARSSWRATLARHGVPAAPEPAALAGDEQIEMVSLWLRDRVAESVSTPSAPVSGADLSFWPSGDASEDAARDIVRRTWGSEAALAAQAAPILEAVSGYYGTLATPRFRFVARLELPGRLLSTGGTPDADGSLWIHRDDDLTVGAVEIAARSVEVADEPLRALGARREFDAVQLALLTDLLGDREGSAELRVLLRTAVERASLVPLRDLDRIPEPLRSAALELAGLLDPDVPSPAGGR
jgi:hypothetical protein